MSRLMLIVADLIVGALLVTGFALTAERGLSTRNLRSYHDALALQPVVDGFGFEGFRLADYPVAFFQDGKEYVCSGDEVSEREPVLGVLVGTSARVDDHFEVFVPDIDDVALISGTIGDDEAKQAVQVRTIWHEALHAWQQTRFESELAQLSQGIDFDQADALVAAIDANAEYRQWFVHEVELLDQALDAAPGSAQRQDLLDQWLAQRDSPASLGLDDEQLRLVGFYETVEGSATYVEALVYRELAGEAAYLDYFRTNNADDRDGTAKYYRSGMLKALLLDELTPGWQAGFDCSQTMDELLSTALGAG